MNAQFLRIFTLASLLLFCSGAFAADRIMYDIASASTNSLSLSPQFTGDAQSLVIASNLHRDGLYVQNGFCCLEGSGHWVFGGWTIPPLASSNGNNMSFSLTALVPVNLGSLRYTFFSGNWSDVWIGPFTLHVWASTNGFLTATKVATHALTHTKPWTDTPNSFTDDLSSLGVLAPGQTLSIRFLASYEGRYDEAHAAPAGFMNKYPSNHNVELDIAAVLSAPVITQQPITQVVQPGTTVTFTVAASGYPPPQFQWHFNGSPLLGATGTTFTVTNAAPAHVGGYSVTAFNTQGTNVSRTADLWLNSLKLFPGVVIYASLGSNVLVQYTTNLQPPILWTPLTNITISTPRTIVIDYDAPETPPRFYQAAPVVP